LYSNYLQANQNQRLHKSSSESRILNISSGVNFQDKFKSRDYLFGIEEEPNLKHELAADGHTGGHTGGKKHTESLQKKKSQKKLQNQSLQAPAQKKTKPSRNVMTIGKAPTF